MKNSWWKIAVVLALVIAVGVVIAGKNAKNDGSAPVPSSQSTAVSSDADKSPDVAATEDDTSVEEPQAKPPAAVEDEASATAAEVSGKPAQPAVQEKPKPVQQKPTAVKKSSAKLPRLVDLGATKCIPCKMMAPILEELAKEYKGKLDVQFIDVWENQKAGQKYGIKSIPTQIFYDANGKEFFRHEGFFSKEDILAKFEAQGIKLPK